MERVKCSACGGTNEVLDPTTSRCRFCAGRLDDGERLGASSPARRQANLVLSAIAGVIVILVVIVLGAVIIITDCGETDDCTTEEQVDRVGGAAGQVTSDAPRNLTSVALGLGALGLTALGLRLMHRRFLLIDVPTSGTTGVFMGLNQVDGTVACTAPIPSVNDTPCAVVRYRREFTVETIGHDGEKHRETTTTSGRENALFKIVDEEGTVTVDPAGAVIHTRVTEERTHQKSRGTERVVHDLVPIGSYVTVLGPVGLDEATIQPRIAADASVGPMVIAVGGEDELLTSDRGWMALALAGALALAVAVVLVAPGLGDPEFPMVLAGPALIGASLFVAYVVEVYNSLARLRESVRRSLSLIDVQLLRRAELIPRLVEVVRGYAGHEHDVLRRVTEARLATPPTSDSRLDDDTVRRTAAAIETQESAVGGLLAVAEDYPDLEASQNFLELQRELAHTESAVAMARRFFHDARLQYRERAHTFPGVLVAWSTGAVPDEPWATRSVGAGTGGSRTVGRTVDE